MTDTFAPPTDTPPSTPVPHVPEQPGTPSTPVPVDNPKLPKPGVHTEKRQPILPPWLKDRSEFLTTARHTGARLGYASTYHGLRLPWYGIQLAAMSPRGACRFIASTSRWLWDREAAPLRDYAVRQEDVAEYMALARLRGVLRAEDDFVDLALAGRVFAVSRNRARDVRRVA